MLVIRHEQLNIFRERKVTAFVCDTCKHLRRFFPDAVAHLDEISLDEFVRQGIKRAATHNITKERDVANFINLMVAIQPEFDQLPAVQAIDDYLNYPGVNGSHKISKFQAMVKKGMFDNELDRSWS